MADAEQRGGLFVRKLRRAFCVRVGEQLLSDGQLRGVAHRLPSGPGRWSSRSPGASCRARGLLVLAVRVVGQVLDNGVHQVRQSTPNVPPAPAPGLQPWRRVLAHA